MGVVVIQEEWPPPDCPEVSRAECRRIFLAGVAEGLRHAHEALTESEWTMESGDRFGFRCAVDIVGSLMKEER